MEYEEYKSHIEYAGKLIEKKEERGRFVELYKDEKGNYTIATCNSQSYMVYPEYNNEEEANRWFNYWCSFFEVE